MSRIKLIELLDVTEQAPQPQVPAPVPAAEKPAAGPTPEEPPITPPADTAPAPEDPGEYDFTKDFRGFEDTKNKAEAVAKKKLLDKMNGRLLGKKITANASRGYGQPKTDYTIDNVKKVSVEFWYKDWVVIVSDENDKKFFLTPGVNIKIEQGGAESPAGAPPEPQADQAPGEPPKAEKPPGPPEGGPPAAPAAPEPPTPEPPPQGGTEEKPNAAPEMPPAPQVPPTPEQPPQPEQPVVPPKKKKRVPVPEHIVQKKVGKFLAEFFNLEQFDVTPYIRSSEMDLRTGASVCELYIPKEVLGQFDNRDLMLEFCDRQSSVDVQSVGRIFILKFSF